MSEIWIPNYGSNDVVVLDTDRLSYIRWITDVGLRPWGICQSATDVFVSNSGEGSVTTINKITYEKTVFTLAEISLGNAPHGIAYDESDAGYFWVAYFADNKVDRRYASNGSRTDGFPVTVGTRPEGIVVTNYLGYKYAWVATSGSDTVTKIPPPPDLPISYNVGKRPIGIASDKNGNIYVACRDSKRVYKLDGEGNHKWYGIDYRSSDPYDPPDYIKTKKRGVFVGHSPIGIAVDDSYGDEEDGHWRVYVTNEVTHNLSILNAYSGEYINTINLAIRPIGISVEKKGLESRVFVVNFDSNTLMRLTRHDKKDLIFDKKKDVIEVGQRPFSIGDMVYND